MKSNKARAMRFGVLGLLVLAIVNLRLFWLPGIDFNTKNWDDENDWIYNATSQSAKDFIFYRDAPGYFVFVPRLIILMGNFVPDFETLSSLRILVFTIQILCYAAAANCVVSLRSNYQIWILVFFTLSITYIEDLNYVHNVGYLFIFPIFLLVIKPILEEKSLSLWRVLVAAILVSKPFTSVLILCLVVYLMFKYKEYLRQLFILGFCQFVYLGCYLILPNRWSTPFSTDPVILLKAVINFPWVLFSSLNPSVSIGVIGFLESIDQPKMAIVVGLIVYLSLLLLVTKFRHTVLSYLKGANQLTKSLIGIFVISYLLAFSASGSYWEEYVPLFLLDYPQHLWSRWSALLPITAILVIASFETISNKIKTLILVIVSSQWILLTVLAQQWLVRYW